MRIEQKAERIVQIQEALALPLGEELRANLLAEQRSIWNQAYPNRPYDDIVRDVWLYRSYS